ncbi:MAG: hypothetical protein AUI90_06770, partial [Deltaproteobacteria bacterium 13_1_40CM_3_69_14]
MAVACGVQDFREAMDVNYFGMVHTTLAALPHLRGHGRIVNICSIGGAVAIPHLLPYVGSKYAAVGFSEGLTVEAAREGIRVTTILPFVMRTGAHWNALFKGRREREVAWFAIGASLPGSSVAADRAARRILRACARGEVYVSVGILAKAMRLLHRSREPSPPGPGRRRSRRFRRARMAAPPRGRERALDPAGRRSRAQESGSAVGAPEVAVSRFKNLDGSGPNAGAMVFRWAVLDRIMGRRRKSPASAAVPSVVPDVERLRTPPAAGEPGRVTWLGHASWLVQLDGTSLLIDPVFGERISYVIRRNAPAPLQPAQLPRIDRTLVTHNHYDHYDRPSVLAAGAPVVTGVGLGKGLPLPVRGLGWWETERIGESVRITYVPSQHWSRRGLFDVNQTLWGGFVIEGSRSRIYHAGDTAYFEGFSQIGARFPAIDAALLPIGAYDPAWFMEKQHMNPEQAIQAFIDLGARHFLAMHWGTFKLTDEPLDEPPERLV